MAAGSFTQQWLAAKAKIAYRGAIPPDPNKFRLALADTNVLTKASNKADFIAAELLPVSGYLRPQFLYNADGTYNAVNERYEMPPLDVSFTATGGFLQFQTAFLLANAHPVSARSFTNVEVNPAMDRIAIASHGLVDGDEVLFTPGVAATLPSGLIPATLYFVVNATTNGFQVSTQLNGPAVDITDTGSGTCYCRCANGLVVALSVEPSQIQILDGTTHSYRIPIVEVNATYTLQV